MNNKTEKILGGLVIVATIALVIGAVALTALEGSEASMKKARGILKDVDKALGEAEKERAKEKAKKEAKDARKASKPSKPKA